MRALFALVMTSTCLTATAAPISPAFCKDPQTFVCGPGSSGADQREKEINAIIIPLQAAALKRTAQLMNTHFDSAAEIDDLAVGRERRQAGRIYFNEIRQGVRAYLKANKVDTNFDFDDLRENILVAIRQAPEFVDADKSAYAQIVKDTRFVSVTMPDSEFENTTLDDRILKGCDNKQLDDNAFSDQRKHGDRVIVICPGYVIGSVEYAKRVGLPRNLYLSPMVATIGHEISHQFDGEVFPPAYAFLQKFLDLKKIGLNPKLETVKYMSESSADFWGNRVFKLYLSQIADPQVRDLILRGGQADLCGSKDDGVHPAGVFRIQVLAQHEYCE